MPDINLFFWLTLTAMAALAAVILTAEKKAEAAAFRRLRLLTISAAAKRDAPHVSLSGKTSVYKVRAVSGVVCSEKRQPDSRQVQWEFFPVVDTQKDVEPESFSQTGLQYALPRLAASARRQEKKTAAVADCHHCA